MRNRLFVPLLLAFSFLPAPAFGQAQHAGRTNASNILVDGYVGTYTYSGATSSGNSIEGDLGASFQKFVGSRFEFLAGARYAPYVDAGGGQRGQHALEDVRIILWVKPRFGFVVGVRPTQVWFSGISKTPVRLIAGVSVRDSLLGAAGRLDVLGEYEIGGCTWATPSNPCPVTASRLRGGLVYQEFAVLPHLRIGVEAVLGRVGEQVNPFAPQVGQTHAFVATVLAVFRIPLFAEKKQ